MQRSLVPLSGRATQRRQCVSPCSASAGEIRVGQFSFPHSAHAYKMITEVLTYLDYKETSVSRYL